jgi:hypothetical protein
LIAPGSTGSHHDGTIRIRPQFAAARTGAASRAPVGVGDFVRLVGAARSRAAIPASASARISSVANSAVSRLTGHLGATVKPGSSKSGDSSGVPACASATSMDSAPEPRRSSAHASALSASASKVSAT